MQTGYFANTDRWTKVHVVKKGKPICGSRIDPNMAFQWCSPDITLGYVECDKCKQKAIEILKLANQTNERSKNK